MDDELPAKDDEQDYMVVVPLYIQVEQHFDPTEVLKDSFVVLVIGPHPEQEVDHVVLHDGVAIAVDLVHVADQEVEQEYEPEPVLYDDVPEKDVSQDDLVLAVFDQTVQHYEPVECLIDELVTVVHVV